MNNIHPTAVIGPNVVLGENVYIGPYCVIGYPAEHKKFWGKWGRVVIGDNVVLTGHVTIDAGTEDSTEIASGVWMLKHSHVGHDAYIGANTVISCGAKIGGHCYISENCNIGLNAVIHQRQHISHGCMIGMGAVVTKKLITVPYRKYAGVPAVDIGVNIKK